MRLVTFRANGSDGWGMVSNDAIATLGTYRDAPGSLLELIQKSSADQLRWLRRLETEAARLTLDEVSIVAPIPEPPAEIIAVGINYRKHLDETTAQTGVDAPPQDPVIFAKAVTSVIGPDKPILLDPRISTQVDWEVELAVVVGRRARDVAPSEALDYVFGYAIANDVSARDLQFQEGGQWYVGKSLDSFCPLGPWIVTADEFGDPSDHAISLSVNGVEKQGATTADLIFSVGEIIAFLSRGRTLVPGTVILTGTPDGVGFRRNPAEFLHSGDEVTVAIEGIGAMSNRVVERR